MIGSFDSSTSQNSVAKPENNRQVRFAMVSDDVVAADACHGHLSPARRPRSDDAIERFNGGGSYSVQVKNTFIELEVDAEEEDPMSLFPRSKTEPNCTVGCELRRGLSDATTDATSDEDDAPTVDESAGEPARCGSSEELINRFNCGGNYSVQVKNTFIEWEGDCEEEDPMSLFPRSKTVPNGAVSCDLLNHDVASSDASSDEDGGAPAVGESEGDRVRSGSSEELINRLNTGRNYSVQVKNTFIEWEEDSEEEDPMSLFPRSKTVPNGAVSCDLLQNRDGAGSDSCGEGGARVAEEMAAGRPAQLPTPFCSTPTPRWEAPLSALWPVAAAHSGGGPAFGHASDVAERPRRQEVGEGPAKAEEVVRSAGAAARSDGRSGSGPGDPKTMGGGRSLQQQTLQSSEVDGFSRAQWAVDGRKLRSSDKRLVSPSFDLDLGLGSGPVAFVLVLYPKSATFKGSSSFKEAGGLGHVHLKCVSELGDDAAAVKVRLSIGRGQARQLRGPLVHSFASSPLFALPKDQSEWDFGSAVEKQPASLFVSVDVALA